MEPIENVDQALAMLEYFDGAASDFDLPLADTLQDKIGMNMTSIEERAAERRWEIAGFEQMPGYRIYHFVDAE